MIIVQDAPFDAGKEINAFLKTNSNSGGVATFVGQVRNFQTNPDGSTTSIGRLELEHYPGMTEKELQRIADESRTRWPLDDVHVIHRFGAMKPGDPIVLVCTAAAHRGDAFSACEFIMDWLKTDAPFWKREQTDSGVSWVDARESDSDRAARWDNQG
jgi:molybdopterin synthase catalytic subunit